MLDFLDRLAAVDLLHIDDLGAEHRTEWVLEQLYTIINTRYEDERSTIVTSNLGPRRARRAARRADRLAPRGHVRAAAVLWPDRAAPTAPPRRRQARERPRRLRGVPGIVIVGAQWGDEGKGKITDLLAERADAVVRFQGGNNAGHTIVRGGEEWKFHLVPSGHPLPGQALHHRQRRRRRPARC